MNTFTNNTVRVLSIAFAAVVLLALPFAIAPKAHAADIFGDSGSSYDYSYPIDTGSSYDYSYPTDTSSSYDYSYPSYSTPSYTDYGSGSGYGGGSLGGGYGVSSFLPFGGSSGMSQSQSQSSTNVNTNVNSCTTGSCNTAINAPTTIVTNNSGGGSNYPVYQPVYTPVYTPAPVYQPVYQPYQQPIAYNQPAPYVSLSAVPYTGLDLGPWGTAGYWGFLILWCLGAAYLIVVKRVQNKIVSKLNGFLFGTTTQKHASQKVLGSASPQPDHFAQQHSAPARTAFSGIDPFIASQIGRAAF